MRKTDTYTKIHIHDDDSNINMVEVVTKFPQYLQHMRENETGVSNIVITNHGTLTGWYNRKKALEKEGLKYIHAVEGYVTWSLEEKVRDNFHITLFAKNKEGFRELNKLVSNSYSREDGHFHYNPRSSWEEIKNTSDNILISTGCLGGMLWQLRKDRDKWKEVIDFIIANKHRVFLEVQPHNNEDQKKLNLMVSKLCKKYDLNIIGGSDTHALNKEHDTVRKILQKSKKIVFTSEDDFDLTFKTYEEMVEGFLRQGVLDMEEIELALKNTNVLADLCEPIEINYDKKYPKVMDGNSKKLVQQKIVEGWKFRGMEEKLTKEQKMEYLKRIAYELSVFETNGALDYLLLEDMVKAYARQEGIKYGYGRGSATGSLICYLLRITELDSIKHGLNFERFMSKERISLADKYKLSPLSVMIIE